jgi:hypothetical protein
MGMAPDATNSQFFDLLAARLAPMVRWQFYRERHSTVAH